MRRSALLAAACLCLVVPLFADNPDRLTGSRAMDVVYAGPKEQIIGRWGESKNGADIVIEFTRKGELKVHFQGQVMATGTYRFVSETTIEVKVSPGGGDDIARRAGIKIVRDEMTFQPEGMPQKETYKRLK